MAGRRPKPTRVKELHGNPGHRPLNKAEPKPTAAGTIPPQELTGAARDEWLRIAPELEAVGILTVVDTKALAGYCQMYARWIDAEENLRKFGAIIKTPKGYPIQNPYLGIANTALDQMRKFMVEFGMTPSSRSRLSVGDGKFQEDPADKYFDNPRPGNGVRTEGSSGDDLSGATGKTRVQ